MSRSRKVGILTKSVTIADLRPYFEMTLKEAADEFGISVAHMKRLCRKCNIRKWPYRILKGIMDTIQQLWDVHKGPFCDLEDREKIEKRVKALERKREAIIQDPSNHEISDNDEILLKESESSTIDRQLSCYGGDVSTNQQHVIQLSANARLLSQQLSGAITRNSSVYHDNVLNSVEIYDRACNKGSALDGVCYSSGVLPSRDEAREGKGQPSDCKKLPSLRHILPPELFIRSSPYMLTGHEEDDRL